MLAIYTHIDASHDWNDLQHFSSIYFIFGLCKHISKTKIIQSKKKQQQQTQRQNHHQLIYRPAVMINTIIVLTSSHYCLYINIEEHIYISIYKAAIVHTCIHKLMYIWMGFIKKNIIYRFLWTNLKCKKEKLLKTRRAHTQTHIQVVFSLKFIMWK